MSTSKQVEVFKTLQVISLSICCGVAAISQAASPQAPIIEQQVVVTKPAPMSRLSLKQRRELETMLTEEVQKLVNRQKRIRGQERNVTVRVTLDIQRSAVIADFSRNYLPSDNNGGLEEPQREIDNLIYGLLGNDLLYTGTYLLIDGKGILEYYPDKEPVIPRKSSFQPLQEPSTVVISAGHGLYLDYGSLEWTAQRDPSNGIVEDFVTPPYASELTTWLHQRSQSMVRNDVRSSSLELHGRSQRPWVEIAARYHLRDQYPNNPEIWNSLPTDTGDDRERKEDIRSRPLYANHVNADTLIHIHTNAFPSDTTVRGARVYVYPGRATDLALASSVLCSMREVIQAQPPYANFPVAAAPHTADLGENRLANMPSILIETAFHTNAADALALQDPVFRTAAMKGVEKGYRLHSQNKPCLPLRITSIPAASGPQNTSIPISVHFEGNPQFPVRLDTVTIACPSGWSCVNYSTPVTAPSPSPIVFNVRCNTSGSIPSAVFGVRTTMVDADGVKSAPFDHSYTCARP